MNERVVTKALAEKFRAYLYEEEKSENTIEKYLRDVRFFAENAGNKKLHKSDVLEYKHTLCQRYAPRSVNSVISSLNAFFMFAEWYELKIKTLKIQKQIFADKKRELEKSEYEKLLTAAKDKKNERLYYLMQSIASTGLRVSEIRYVTVDAVENGEAVINCKGKIRQVFLPKKLCGMLKKYVKSQGIKSGSVFVSKNGNPLNRCNIWKMLKDLCESANVDKSKVFPHNFRHLFARTFYSLQKDIVRLAGILGHSSINTTRIYTMETGEIHRRQIQHLGLLRC